MSEWAPIVHGRTAFVDFRAGLVVIPSNFTADDVSWARKYILSTTRWPEELPDGPLWSVFQNERFLVAGVTCMARDVSSTMTRELAMLDGYEVERRDLFVFLGYVARRPTSEIPRRNIDQFRPLYHFIEKRWREQWYDSADSNPSDVVFRPDCEPVATPTSSRLTESEEMIAVWPDDLQNELWVEAPSNAAISLCVGVPSRSGLRLGSFNNVVVRGSASHETLARPPAETRSMPQRISREDTRKPLYERSHQPEVEQQRVRAPKKPGLFKRLFHKVTGHRFRAGSETVAATITSPVEATTDEPPSLMPLIRFNSELEPRAALQNASSSDQPAPVERFRKRERETREGEPWEGWGNDDSNGER